MCKHGPASSPIPLSNRLDVESSAMSTAATSVSPCDSPCADALDRLSLGHEQTRALADECRRFARHMCGEPAMQEVAEALCRAIHRMAALEEELFFPAARAALEASQLVDLAELEHATARQIIRQLQHAEPGEARYQALVLALTECVERHARHEQAKLFPRLRESCMDMGALEQQLNERLAAQDDDQFIVEERRVRQRATAH
jgi:Hemerythrin HHE cation binding domain